MKNLQVNFPNQSMNSLWTIVALEGNFNAMNAINFKRDLLNILSDQQKHCMIDLQNISDMDLTALNSLAMAHLELKKKGKKLLIKASNTSPIKELLHITKLGQYLDVKFQ